MNDAFLRNIFTTKAACGIFSLFSCLRSIRKFLAVCTNNPRKTCFVLLGLDHLAGRSPAVSITYLIIPLMYTKLQILKKNTIVSHISHIFLHPVPNE